MEFTVNNLGPLKSATLQIKDLTILCGRNNSGKTYLTYTLYSFINHLRETRVYRFSEEEVQRMLSTGRTEVQIQAIVQAYRTVLESGDFVSRFTRTLARDLAVPSDRTRSCTIDFSLGQTTEETIEKMRESQTRAIGIRESPNMEIRISHQQGSDVVSIGCGPVHSGESVVRPVSFPLDGSIMDAVYWGFSMFVSRHLFRAFFITCERNGVITFGQELNIFNAMAFNGENRNIELLRNLRKRLEFEGYPLPVRREKNMALELYMIQRRRPSFIALQYADILRAFDSISGGEYSVSSDPSHALSFRSEGSEQQLGLNECSSSVKSLVELNYYLRFLARENDILIVDEPELDLHPELHRRLARLLVRIANAGIRVLVSTHSDYLMRELNVLLSLYDKDRERRHIVATALACDENEMIDPLRVACHVIGDGHITPMDFIKDVGFPIQSFDQTIGNFNKFKRDARLSICNRVDDPVTDENN